MRLLTTHSSGKMGYAVARAAAMRGADVTLVSGPVSLTPPEYVHTVPVTSAEEMFEAVRRESEEADVIVKAAAVADYTPCECSEEKIKKTDGTLSVPLRRTTDILAYLGAHKRPGQVLCGFSMETENLVENSRAKLLRKNADLICANSLRTAGAGFGVDTNVLTLITADDTTELPLQSKDDAAHRVLDKVLQLLP